MDNFYKHPWKSSRTALTGSIEVCLKREPKRVTKILSNETLAWVQQKSSPSQRYGDILNDFIFEEEIVSRTRAVKMKRRSTGPLTHLSTSISRKSEGTSPTAAWCTLTPEQPLLRVMLWTASFQGSKHQRGKLAILTFIHIWAPYLWINGNWRDHCSRSLRCQRPQNDSEKNTMEI